MTGKNWVAAFHIWASGIRPNPSESHSLPNPSESGTLLGDSFNPKPKIAPNRPKSSKSPKIVLVCPNFCAPWIRLRSGHLPESARIRPNPTLHRIRPNPEPASQGKKEWKSLFATGWCRYRAEMHRILSERPAPGGGAAALIECITSTCNDAGKRAFGMCGGGHRGGGGLSADVGRNSNRSTGRAGHPAVRPKHG